ncbi:hypothetical protein GBAR_LOCUS9374 [Geodia barretti]|uniref:Transmembrane protein n=1 Tax=Geodia barretti TaxID=519541 RepID=A0AA35RQI8_GEOBA|nr:hypothetical protein GBAR_LOCUS9374 [Geodia barretti]
MTLPSICLKVSNRDPMSKPIFKTFWTGFSNRRRWSIVSRVFVQHCTMSCRLARLPRVMIIFLKRYGYTLTCLETPKRIDFIRIPNSLLLVIFALILLLHLASMKVLGQDYNTRLVPVVMTRNLHVH